ncbi:MAG TPA: ABC transporter permease, partial [Edaphobacter sp.]|nr:ABC transporter permease [Edaphobacter sp.]
YVTMRDITHLVRQPWFVALTLLQPVVWIVMYGQLFGRVVELPGFHARSYIDFITPGIVVMSALFSSSLTGIGTVDDIDRGVMDRFLVSPATRAAIIIGRLMNQAIVTVVQSLILFLLAALMGARYPGGLADFAVLLIAAILLAIPFAALSRALGLVFKKQESVIGAVNFFLLHLTFSSSVFIAQGLMPPWMQAVSELNPVNWSVAAGRAALGVIPTAWVSLLSSDRFADGLPPGLSMRTETHPDSSKPRSSPSSRDAEGELSDFLRAV